MIVIPTQAVISTQAVIPAKAGIQRSPSDRDSMEALDPRLRGDDDG